MTAPDCVTCDATGEHGGICPDCYGVGWYWLIEDHDWAETN